MIFCRKQYLQELISIDDHFRKIIITGDDIHRKEDEQGILTIGLFDFLTDKELLFSPGETYYLPKQPRGITRTPSGRV